MPKRTDIKRILVIGSGPIIIGQAGEFDYSGSQAVKALKNLGYYVVVINSNPATVMTDPDISDKTYIEPIINDTIEQIIQREKIEAILPTVGGQTALNATLELQKAGILEKYNIELLGVNTESIEVAESRELFNKAMEEIGLECPKGKIVHTYNEAMEVPKTFNYPLIIRPSFTLGGTGGGVAYNEDEFIKIVKRGLELSPTNELVIEQSLLGWKEYEYEVIRDLNDNAIIIASVENFDPMGVHTGDSITVAPAQTLTDKEYQKLRDYSLAIIRKIGVATGGSNIQFGVNPENGDVKIIEMNPRVSRSSALVSKATGFPIAKIAAQLAVGLTLDEITNEITGTTPASFEPTLDYIVVKIPRWDFEKFSVEPNLTTQMKSVGEVMSIGSNFREAIQKAFRSLEIGVDGLNMDLSDSDNDTIIDKLKTPTPLRPFYLKEAFKRGMSIDEVFNYCKIDPWFLDNVKQIVDFENEINQKSIDNIGIDKLKEAKLNGFSDKQLASLLKSNETEVREKRKSLKVIPTYKKVDTCSAEFEAQTPYFYSTYLRENESIRSDRKKIMVLGGGPFRIGQGIEFDYCASQASLILKDLGIETIMVNCNPETVSTDYDTSDKLYFEPVTYEDVMNIIDLEKPDGIILQLGGQTPLNLSKRLKNENVVILGTSQESIDRAEDRGSFLKMLDKLNIPYPIGATAHDLDSAVQTAVNIGFPVIVRPSYVLGGRGMMICYNEYELQKYIETNTTINADNPVLIDKFLENAIEIDVDAISDGEETFIAGIMQHIEEAGIHSGDSSSVLPANGISEDSLSALKDYTLRLSNELKIKGFMNIQYAIYRGSPYVIEVNPRASRTVPYVSKSIGVALTKLAVKLMIDEKKLDPKEFEKYTEIDYYTVKAPVFSFNKFPGVDTVLGPEMRSTGEVMGISQFFGEAYVKSQIAAGNVLPMNGTVFLSVNDFDKQEIIPIAKKLIELGFKIVATLGTYNTLKISGVEAELIPKIGAGSPNVVEKINSGDVDLIINTPLGRRSYQDDVIIREAALQNKIHCITALSAAKAAVDGIKWLQKNQLTVYGPITDRTS